jgi:uncharacterized protein YkwD
VVLAAMLAAGGAAASDTVVPDSHGARNYFAPPVPGSGTEAMTDRLQRELFEAVTRAARAKGQRPPVPDARLEAFADTLARNLGADEVPGVELQEFLLSHHGLGDPVPELAMLQVGLDDEVIRNKISNSLPRILQGGPFGRVGIGVYRRWLRTSVVVALQRVDLELLPIPRRLDVGASALVGGRLLRGYTRPAVLVAPPSGMVRELPLRSHQDSFQTSFRCDAGTGRYQVEIMGSDQRGKTVLANFPIFCGVTPPRSSPKGSIGGPESSDPARAETLLLEAVNRDRVAANLAPLILDPILSRAARAYSQEMAETQKVDHLSLRSGNAADRVRRAGSRVLLILENIGRANSIADAQKSFMSSPGHRLNVLDRRVTRLGAGVALRRESGGVPTLYVTQLFAR